MSNIAPPWVPVTHPVKDGEDVKAVVANRQPNELQQRTDYLKALLDSINAGEALFARNVALDPSVQAGQAVYWDVQTLEYRPAIAKVTFNPSLGGFTIDPSSYAVGIVAYKYTSTRGDVMLSGKIRKFDFTQAIGTPGNTPPDAGPYYLSASQPGHYTKQKPPVGIYIGFLCGDGSAHINPTPREVLENHIHYKVDLIARPAGTIQCPTPNDNYVFMTVDPSQPGWLPADDPTFMGLAPIGAKLGYNIAQHPELQRLWPPIPTGNAYLEMDGIGVDPIRFQIDLTTIWWFEDCYSKAPFATEARPCGVPSSSSSSSSSANPSSSSSSSSFAPFNCDSGPMLESMGFVYNDPTKRRMSLFFTKMIFKTNNTLVTSLRPAPDSPIKVLGCDKLTPASTGDLCLDLDLALTIQEDQPGYQVFKDVTGSKFKRGPVVEGVKAGPFISLQPVPGESLVDAQGFVYGKAIITGIPLGSNLQEGQVSLVALDGVREDKLNGIFFLSMTSTKATSFTGRIVLPSQGAVLNPQMQLVFWVLGRVAGVLPAIQLKYKRLAKPVGCNPVVLPSIDTTLPDLPGCSIVSPNVYVEETSDPFPVADGDEIIFTATRQGFTNDGYNGDIGLLKIGYVLTPS